MRIKKFTANNYADALAQVKRELGEEALIMSTRSIKPPNAPLSSRNTASKVEITAAVEFKEAPVATLDEELNLDEESRLDMKSLLFNLLSEQGKAQTLGLKASQFETYSHLVENGL
ncbi:MAG: flagellar biosynthesis protein FlhF, partial [Nitrospinota bacterium]